MNGQLEVRADVALVLLLSGFAGSRPCNRCQPAFQAGANQGRFAAGLGQIDLLMAMSRLPMQALCSSRFLSRASSSHLSGVERGLLRAEAIGVEHVQLTVVDTGQLAQALMYLSRVFSALISSASA